MRQVWARAAVVGAVVTAEIAFVVANVVLVFVLATAVTVRVMLLRRSRD